MCTLTQTNILEFQGGLEGFHSLSCLWSIFIQSPLCTSKYIYTVNCLQKYQQKKWALLPLVADRLITFIPFNFLFHIAFASTLSWYLSGVQWTWFCSQLKRERAETVSIGAHHNYVSMNEVQESRTPAIFYPISPFCLNWRGWEIKEDTDRFSDLVYLISVCSKCSQKSYNPLAISAPWFPP